MGEQRERCHQAEQEPFDEQPPHEGQSGQAHPHGREEYGIARHNGSPETVRKQEARQPVNSGGYGDVTTATHTWKSRPPGWEFVPSTYWSRYSTATPYRERGHGVSPELETGEDCGREAGDQANLKC